MLIPDNDLNQWRRFVSVLYASMKQAEADLNAGRPEHARQLVTQTAAAAVRMGLKLEEAGAVKPGEDAGSLQMLAEGVPLHLLDTPANRRYAETLQDAYKAALAVDRERYGESIGTDGCAQMIEAIMRNTLGEVVPPTGRVPE